MRIAVSIFLALAALGLVDAQGADAPAPAAAPEAAAVESFRPEEKQSDGSVVIGGQRIDYQAIAGTLVVHPKGWDDVPQNADKDAKGAPTEASIFFVAYLKKGARPADRPLTFIYNGGPGSSTAWLHMGAFGPRRVATADGMRGAAAPYAIVNNDYSLLDASDLVFIDAPGTGFSRTAGKDREKAFYGVDGDAHAFADFIAQFLGKYGRWNSPKFLFGESYGTTRSAALVALLETDESFGIDVNGVILLSQILMFDGSDDGPGRDGSPEDNPGVELPYELSLPTYAATAWYHHRLPQGQPELAPFLAEVEDFALGDYATALAAGSALPPARRQAVADKLHAYTGLPVDYLLKANLRVNGAKFEQNVLGDGRIVGRVDTRYTGPAFDPLAENAEYDAQLAAISSPYVAAFNDYVRKDLKFGEGRRFKLFADDIKVWNADHQAPGAPPVAQGTSLNVIPDLSIAMKYNPRLKVQLNAGYYDLATPFFQGVYEMRHLLIPPQLQDNIEFRFYESGHMVYARPDSLRSLHANVAGFIAANAGAAGAAGH
jgi:carboxypeptidase C (cathepsin A)